MSAEPYFHEERFWRCIAASHQDDDGTEYVTPEDAAEIGVREREEEWRFLDLGEAVAFADEIGAEPPHRIADGPRRCNGWVVRVREQVPA